MLSYIQYILINGEKNLRNILELNWEWKEQWKGGNEWEKYLTAQVEWERMKRRFLQSRGWIDFFPHLCSFSLRLYTQWTRAKMTIDFYVDIHFEWISYLILFVIHVPNSLRCHLGTFLWMVIHHVLSSLLSLMEINIEKESACSQAWCMEFIRYMYTQLQSWRPLVYQVVLMIFFILFFRLLVSDQLHQTACVFDGKDSTG